jgi:ABC-type spermidine/putrescine transport system permease subunit I
VEGDTRTGAEGLAFSARVSLLLALPLLAFLAVAYLAPIISLLPASVSAPAISFGKYLDLAHDPLSQTVLLRTFRIALEVTALVVLLGYPTALLIWRANPPAAAILLVLVLFPLYTSVLVRNYAWTALLARNGVINELLRSVGVIQEPLRLLNTERAVLIGMVHVLVPYAILPIYTALRRIDPVYVQASEILGASPLATFRRVVLPLSLPGTIAAAVLVFVLSLGFYITPAILGGPRSLMAANLIDKQVNYLLDFGGGAATAIVLLLLSLLLMAVAFRVFDVDHLLREGT